MKVCKFDIELFDMSIFDFMYALATLAIKYNQSLLGIQDYKTKVDIKNEDTKLRIVR